MENLTKEAEEILSSIKDRVQKQIRTERAMIAKFMGLELIRIGYYGRKGLEDGETEWQVENREWLDKPEIVAFYDHSVGNYFVNIKENIIIPEDEINYQDDYNYLMEVVEKIENQGFKVIIEGSEVCIFKKQTFLVVHVFNDRLPYKTKKQGIYDAVISFIHNEIYLKE